MEPERRLDVLRDGALLGLLVPASLTGMGFLRVQAYQHRLGLHDSAALPPLETLALSGMDLVIGPLMGLVAVYLLMWGMKCAKAREYVEPLRSDEIPLLAWLAAGAWLAAIISLADIGDETPRVLSYSDLTVLDVVLFAVGGAFVAILVLLPFFEHPILRVIGGRSVAGVVMVGLLLFAGLASHAQFAGVDEGSADAWACVEFQGVQFIGAPEPFKDNTTYMLITHESGLYFVRDTSQQGTELEVMTVHETMIESARLARVPPLRSC